MPKILVAFFSPDKTAHNTTRHVAKLIAKITKAKTYEIKPKISYTQADMNWHDENSRSSREMADKNFRPELADTNLNVEDYNIIYLGFPIWWYVAPHLINNFLESYNFAGKTIITFATSDGSDFGETLDGLIYSNPDARFIEGRVFRGTTTEEDVEEWIKTIEI